MSWIIDLIAKLFGLWVNKTPEIAPVAEKLGRAEVERDDAQAGAKAIGEAHNASAAVLRGAIADPSVLRQPDPDSRD